MLLLALSSKSKPLPSSTGLLKIFVEWMTYRLVGITNQLSCVAHSISKTFNQSWSETRKLNNAPAICKWLSWREVLKYWCLANPPLWYFHLFSVLRVFSVMLHWVQAYKWNNVVIHAQVILLSTTGTWLLKKWPIFNVKINYSLVDNLLFRTLWFPLGFLSLSVSLPLLELTSCYLLQSSLFFQWKITWWRFLWNVFQSTRITS
jgi:hypothetical protein